MPVIKEVVKMPTGPFGEILGTTGTLDDLSPTAKNYKSKVVAPRNPKIIRGEEEVQKITPSKYMFDAKMSTEQKLANTRDMRIPIKVELLDMGETTHQRFSQVNIDEPMFQPFPSEIYYQQFEPFETYEVPLVLRNNDKVPRLVKVTQADSPYFKVISPNNVGHKVGPGLPTTFKLQFRPDEKKDYYHELVCITEREKFIVPVRAIGARAILDFPDEIHFPISPVKYPSTKTVLVRNIGNTEARFSLDVNEPYSVSPVNGVLPVDESLQVTVQFRPTKVGDHKTDLILTYDTGEEVYISLYGAAQDSNVRLDKNSIRVENTFISMANQRTVTISNRTDVIAHFRWTQFATEEEENSHRKRIVTDLNAEQKTDTDRFLEECISDPTLRDKLSILERTFKNRRNTVVDDKMFYDDEVIQVDPVEGDIWPNSTFDVSVVFKPRQAKTYMQTAFCDITGRESRLPLRVRGDGIGPTVQFSFQTLDMGNIFIGSSHTYEVVMANKGDIDAMFTVVPKSSIFGPCFTFNPAEGIVMPGGHQAIQISFSSPYLGDFHEEFQFQVDGQPEDLTVTFTGSVVGPTFQFDVPKLKFGLISYGFLNTKECMLSNTSLVPMKYHLRVPGDGVVPSICATSDHDSTKHGFVPTGGPPKEFEIIPETGTLPPQSDTKIKVNFISNTARKYEMALVVDVENVGEDILSLPILAKCIVPQISVLNPFLDYGRCFLGHPYQLNMKFHNDTDLPAKYEVVPQSPDATAPVFYRSPVPKGILEPHSMMEVPMILESRDLHELETVAQVLVFGSQDPPLPVQLGCVGEGPVVHIAPLAINWGTIRVLEDSDRVIVLSNESLISAKFKAYMLRPRSVFRIEPEEGEIPAEQSIELRVIACLNDCVKFEDKLQVSIGLSQVRTIPLSAFGEGTTIVSEPPLGPVLDLGPNFSNRQLKKTFLLTNKGRRNQQLVWSTEGFQPIKHKKTVVSNPMDMKNKGQAPVAQPPKPVFKLTPYRMDMAPGESLHMTLEGIVKSPEYVRERLLCHAIIGRQGGKELVMKVDVSSQFISPLVEFSAKSLFFRVDKHPDDELEVQYRELMLTNVSSLPLTTVLSLKYPFQMIDADGIQCSDMDIELAVNEAYNLRVQFDPAYKDDHHIRTIDEVLTVSYREHPHIDYIALRGEVYFPNLDFENMEVDFGCILNNTEVTRYVNITNNSPMEVKYKWSFLIGNEPCTKFIQRPKVAFEEESDGESEASGGSLVEEEEEEEAPNVEVVIETTEEEELIKSDNIKTEEGKLDIVLEEVEKAQLEKSEKDNRVHYQDDNKALSDEGMEKGQLDEEGGENGVEKDEGDRPTDSRVSEVIMAPSPEMRAKTPLEENTFLAALLNEEERDSSSMGIEEVFDILPLYGTLRPGDTEQVTLTFFGHADIWGQARAICEVEGGPTYELALKGQASLVEYRFDTLDIDYGKQMYDQVASAEIRLMNCGQVGFEFTALNIDPAMAKRPKPGVPVVLPHTGYIAPMSEQTLIVKYIPGVPEKFHKSFAVQVAHFEPDIVEVRGEGVFPRVSLDLPRALEGSHSDLLKQAEGSLAASDSTPRDPPMTYRSVQSLNVSQNNHAEPAKETSVTEAREDGDNPDPLSALDSQLEMERLLVKEFALSHMTGHMTAHDPQTPPPDSHESQRCDGRSKKKTKSKAILPDYVLDFGYVVYGTVRTHVVRATNTGWFPVSFQVERGTMHSTGFNVELDKVRQLPGAPDHETVDFVVSFDPKAVNLPLGPVEATVPINVVGGPLVRLKLCADVTMPDMEISDKELDFSEVKCGECKVVTVQLHNHQKVRCDWSAHVMDRTQTDKHTPMHIRRKLRQEKKANHFEVMPPTGSLMPGQRSNIQVKFMPTEEKFYELNIPLRISQSTQRILLQCKGQGREPHLDFEPNLQEFGPVLAHSSGDEQEIIVRNPCAFPIEFYNLEFDKGYLEEERILRLMRGYDENNTILLPPRSPAEKLPQELLEFYEELLKKYEDAEREKQEALELAEQAKLEQAEQAEEAAGEAEAEDAVDSGVTKVDPPHGTLSKVTSDTEPPQVQTELTQIQEDQLKEKDDAVEEKLRESVSSSMGVGELEITPVSAAIARYLGIDLSSEGKAARNRRGVAIIVNGAPLSGKTSTAVMLAKQYEAALLTVNSVVMDAIANGNTPAGLKARELCAEAARRRAEELRVLEGEDGERRPVAGGLSVEAVTAHTQQGLPKNTDLKAKGDKHVGGSLAGNKTVANTSTTEGATGSQVPSSPPPLLAPIARQLSVSGSVGGEDGLLSCVLPEDVLVEILAERLQLSDCHSGIVFDGLETLFSQNMYTTAVAILKALNNRRFLFFVTLKLDYSKLKEQERLKQEEQVLAAERAEEEERRRLEEMSEEEYDALSEEEKAHVDRKRLDIKKERIRREMEEKAERDRLEQLAREEEQRRLEEEKLNKRRNKKQNTADLKDGKKSVAAGRGIGASESKMGQKGGKGHDDNHLPPTKTGSTTDRPESHHTEKSDTLMEADGKKKKSVCKDGKRVDGKERREGEGTEEGYRDPVKDSELLLMQRFRTFEHGMKDVLDLLENWDRAAGQLKRPPTPSEKSDGDEGHPPSGKRTKAKDKHDKQKEKELQEKLEREKAEKAAREAAQSDGEAVGVDESEADGEEKDLKPTAVIGVPHIVVDCGEPEVTPGPIVAQSDKLPSMEEVLDGLGLGARGPPIPPPAMFSVIPYPVKRRAPAMGEMAGHYMFVASSPDDPNIGAEEKPKDIEEEEISAGTPDKPSKDDHTPAKGKTKDKQKGGADKMSDRKKSAGKKTSLGRRSSMQAASPPPGITTPGSEADALSTTADSVAITEPKNPKLTIFRWVVPAHGEVLIRLRFQSEELGQFDQTLNFEVVGTRRRYQVYCRGVCAFPTISREPRIVFPHRKKSKKFDEIVHKKFILTEEMFEFGPLLVGKTRDKYKEGKFPENMEKINIVNTSPLEADISFCFLKDSKADTFLLDPPNMVLKPKESQELSVWAYPKVPGRFEDAVVCCVRENPEPIVFKLSCDGVRPELELDKKQLHFDKVLLHRKDTKTIYLRNSTLLPVTWKLCGLENLGDDFSVTTETGVIEAKSEYALNAYFRAMKPVNQLKKNLRLEVSDVENIMGVVQTEAIQVLAEAYDVALDMSFPKGADGGLDFGTIRVMDETKQTCSLKNKGKYEIAFKFVFEDADPANPGVTELFSVIPDKGTLSPLDRPTQVQVIFRSRNEIRVKDVPILKCQVIEPNVKEGGETIASIPIKVSVRAVFSKYNILPLNDINFGSLLVNSKKTRTFFIENKGEFDFKYTISKMVKETAAQNAGRNTRPPVKGEKRTKSRDGSSSGRSIARTGKKADSIRQEGVGQSRLVLGAFTVYPAYGVILPNGHQVISVDCVGEQQGRFDEELAVDITDRNPSDHPSGVPYRLIAEACIPSINIENVGIIFEEHRVCRNLSVWQHGKPTDDIGVYGEDEKKFVFNNVIVGRKAKARFKISNTNKVPCDVVFSIKPVNSRGGSKQTEIFEVDPPRTQVPNHSFIYATVSFSPPSMQSYSAMFEAVIDGLSPNQAKGRSLIFEVTGDGNLPRINISKPSVRNKRGQPLLLFKRTLVGREDCLPLVLTNDGTLPSKVDIDLIDPDEVFNLRPSRSASRDSPDIQMELEGRRRAHTASVVVDVGETALFDVLYRPSSCQRSQAHVRLSVIDNQYEDSVIQMVGEGYQDDITLDNIRSAPVTVDPEKQEGNMAEDDVAAAKPNLIQFGDCYINEQRCLSLTMTNHSSTDSVRFQWPDHPELTFSPQIGHLHANSNKDISITFKATEAKTLEEVAVNCSVTKITFDKPLTEICDWDDRIRSVKWIDVRNSSDSIHTDSAKGQSSTPPPPTTARPAKKKVVESEPEPAHQEAADTTRPVELLVSATADYCKYKCKVDSVQFKDTLMFQTRVYEFTLSNKGSVKMDYNWQVVMDNFTISQRSVTFYSEPEPDPDRPSSRGSLTIGDIPFTVQPEYGTILPDKKATIQVKFSPLDVNEFEGRLICSLPNLENDKQGPVISLKGKSLMPYCHFELEDSDYISGARRNPELRGPGGAPPGSTLDSNTRVLEFKTIGVGIRTVRKFSIINPTNQTYKFEWTNEDENNPKRVSTFSCLTPKGVVRPGKKAEVAFEFTSVQLDIEESFWRFTIPEQNISVPFLLVADTRDPDISLDRSHLNFRAVLIGHEAVEQVYLVNNEEEAFSFAFREDSCHSAGFEAHLRVEPLRGLLPPKSRLPISLYFIPSNDKEVNFNLMCKVKRKLNPLAINIKAEGYAMKCDLLCEDSSGNSVELSDSALNEIKFGEVEVHEASIRNLTIINSGKFNFDYKWEVQERSAQRDMLRLTPLDGGVKFGEKQKCVLSFCPPCKTNLRGSELTLKISHGPQYNILVTGLGVTPGLHLSFLSYDFGPVFVHKAGMPARTTHLKLTNRDRKEISVDCLFTPTAHLHHTFEACVIAPGETVSMPITFYPRQAVQYHETLEFEINGLSRQSVEIFGMGTEMKVEVADPKQRIVNLGNLVVHKSVKKQVMVANNSLAPITFNLALNPTTAQLQQSGVLSVTPIQPISLDANGGQTKVEVVFSPKSRIPQFSEEVLVECAGTTLPLFVVQGSCLGMDVRLDTDAVPFGAVILRSQSTRKVVMYNQGDMNAKFMWDIKRFQPDFSVTPVQGYLTPGMEVTFDVTFHPQEIKQDIRYEKLRCFIQGGPHPPVTLTLTGMCTSLPPVKEVQHFNTHVRQRDTKQLPISNKTNQMWTLKPVIDGEQWSGPVTLVVEPQQTRMYEITYHPLTMTPEGKKHQGSVFFPIPDGTGIMFNLSGTSEPPKASNRITRDVPCKTTYAEMLPIENWLKKPQRFRVKIECLKSDRLDAGTTVKGMEYIDVPSNCKKDYKLNFHAYREGVSQVKVTFTNEQTGEYQYYEVMIRATRPGVMGSIDLTTPVRQSVPHTVMLENPLTYAVVFSASCNISEVLMPSQLSVPGQSSGRFNLEYQPLKAGETQGRLEFMCNDLGLYTYDLNLKATPAGPERALYFRACLGTSQVQVAKFLNFAKQKADYSCKVDSTDFHADRAVAAAPGSTGGTEIGLDVTFEPSKIGEQRSTLTVSSPHGGEYTFPLFGTCLPPKPQGPFVIKAGSTTSLTFRNVFGSPTPFTFQVDNPSFHLTKSGENIRPRKDHRIVVGFDGNDSGSKSTVMGKLIVSCARSAGGSSNVQWVYYLKGITP